MRWTERRLDELGYVGRGKSKHRPRDAGHLYGGPYPFIQTGDVKHADLYITQYSQTYSEAGLAQSKLWPAGTLCITIAANIAETAILGIDACFPDSVIGFVADDSKSDARFVKYLFDTIKQQYQQVSQGAAQDNLSLEKLLSFKLRVPEPEVQRSVANVLSAYDDLIENNRRRMALLEESARLLYREWFVRLRFPGHEHTPIVNGLPEGWERKPLAELCESIDYGYTASAEAGDVGPKFLRITDIVPDVIDWSTVPHCRIEEDRFKKFRLIEGDIVIARTGATVGYAKRINKRTPDAVFASYLVRLRLNSDIDSVMAGIFVESEDYKKYVQSRVGGAAQPNANARILTAVDMVVPTPRIQRAFREIVEPLVDQRETLQEQNQRLKAARDLLLPRLMNGEITARHSRNQTGGPHSVDT
ncbi:MAG: restriction endonuclease subunit S [Bryobacteraceae bacterium]